MKKEKTARHSWDNYIQKIHGELLTWKTMAILSMSAVLVTIVFASYYYIQPKYIPYVVSVSENKIDFEGVITARPIQLNDAMIRNYLIRFIKDIRTITTDAVIQKNQLVDAYYLSSPEGQVQLSEYIGEEQFLKLSAEGELRRDIQFVSFERVAESTWRVQWQEQERIKGAIDNVIERAGTFSYDRRTAITPEEAEINPLGIYFDSFFITSLRDIK